MSLPRNHTQPIGLNHPDLSHNGLQLSISLHGWEVGSKFGTDMGRNVKHIILTSEKRCVANEPDGMWLYFKI